MLYPTDTIWGLGCSMKSESACQKISTLKKRPSGQSFILLVSDIDHLKQYVTIHPRIETLLSYLERPLTIVYEKHHGIPAHCVAPDGSIAIRVVQDEFCQTLIKTLGYPITSTSANLHGTTSPKHFGEISSEVITGCDFVFNYRRHHEFTGEPSPIASFDKKGRLHFIRE